MVILPIYTGAFLALLILPISKDWGWFEAWAFIITFVINVTISYAYINKKNPRVLRNRMKLKKEGLTAVTKKSAESDRFIYPIMTLGFFGALMLPGLDHRFGWTTIPFAVEIIGLVVMNVGLVIMNITVLQNSFASKILDINKGQKLIDTGLYAHIRHPLYAGAILLILAMPIALGSWWALIPAAVVALTVVARIKFEEEMLEKGMARYTDYQKRVRYKLLPKIY